MLNLTGCKPTASFARHLPLLGDRAWDCRALTHAGRARHHRRCRWWRSPWFSVRRRAWQGVRVSGLAYVGVVEPSDRTGSQPIVVRWLWNDCDLLGGGRAYVVEIPAGRVSGLLGAQPHDREETYLEYVAASAARLPGTVTPGHVTCIVSADGRVIDSYVQPLFPYSGMWNGYCPLRRMGIHVADLADLQRISDKQVQKSLDEDIAATSCLDPGAWDGTELESGRV